MLHAALKGLGAGFRAGGIAGKISSPMSTFYKGYATGQIARSAVSSITGIATGRYGMTAASTMYGGIAGGAYGAASDRTSILGGGMAGAGMAGAGIRYADRGIRWARGGRGFGRGVVSQARRDYRGVALAANRGINRVTSSLGQGIAANRIYSDIRRGF